MKHLSMAGRPSELSKDESAQALRLSALPNFAGFGVP